MTGPGEPLQVARAVMSTPFAWGRADCAASACLAWSILWGRADPMAAFRGAYASEAEARAITAGPGGFAGLAGRVLEAAGLVTTDAPEGGDLAMVGTRIGPALGLVLGAGRIAVKGARGCRVVAVPTVLGAWTCRS